jgi:hypothetical protein
MKQHLSEMIEGPEATRRFIEATRAILRVPKSAVPNPFGKRSRKKPKATTPKAK